MPNAAGQGNSGYMVFANLDGVGMGSLKSADIPTQTLVTANVGAEMSPTFYNWVGDSLKRGVARNGAVVSTDYSRNVIFWDEWSGGQISQLVFPAVDAGSSAKLTLNLSMQCRNIRRLSDAPSKYTGCHWVTASALVSRNFSLSIDGLPDCKHVMTVDSMIVGGRLVGAERGPDLSLTLKETHAGSFRSWQQTGTRKAGSFQYLKENLSKPIFVLSFGGLIVSSISPPVPLNPTATVTVKLRSTGFQFTFWPV